MDLPTFLWLWKIAAWSMGGVLLAYTVLLLLGGLMYRQRQQRVKLWLPRYRLRQIHIGVGGMMVGLVMLLLSIGIVGTLGHYGSLGHSWHLPAGLSVVILTLGSAISASQIQTRLVWARELHVVINTLLCFALIAVLISGWDVVQKYLP